MIRGNLWLVAGAWLSVTASLLHVACIFGGPDWYRLLGAGEGLAKAAARGSWTPALLTLSIASILVIWAAYAFSGVGLISRLPLLRTGLVVISAIYLARGLFVFSPATFGRPDLSPQFIFWSSAIVLAIGLCYAVGTWTAWPHLSHGNAI